MFYKFLSTFPIKTPKGRYLSPAGTEGVLVNNLKKKWNKIFKNKPLYEEKAINVLEAELSWRKKTNGLEYIHAAEAWLNGGDYEKYEYLLEDSKEEQIKYQNLIEWCSYMRWLKNHTPYAISNLTNLTYLGKKRYDKS